MIHWDLGFLGLNERAEMTGESLGFNSGRALRKDTVETVRFNLVRGGKPERFNFDLCFLILVGMEGESSEEELRSTSWNKIS